MLSRRAFLAGAGGIFLTGAARAQEPTWIAWPAKRQADVARLGPILADIEGHLDPGNIYTAWHDLPGWGHEGTHAVNEQITDAYKTAEGLYFPIGRALVVPWPPVRLSALGQYVPGSLRGINFDVHLRQQAQGLMGMSGYDHRATYVFNEFVAYANAAYVCLDQWRARRGADLMLRLSCSLEDLVYGTVLVAVVAGNPRGYDERQLRGTWDWCWRWWLSLYEGLRQYSSLDLPRAQAYLSKLRTSPDAAWMRTFIQGQLDAALAKEILAT